MNPYVPQIKEFTKGSVIFNEGDSGNVAYLIQEGAVNIVKNINDKKNVLATLNSGELFGEMAVISNSPRTAGAEAVTDCSLTVLTAKLIYALLKKSHPTVFHLTRMLVSRLAAANNVIAEKRSENIWMTLCRFLDLQCRIARKNPETTNDIGIEYKSFCADLKQIINISSLEIDRMLKSAASVKLITISTILHEVRIGINAPDTFLETAANLSDEFNRISGVVCQTDFMDIYDFAKAVGSTPQIIYKKIGAGEFPDSVCKLHKRASKQWAKEKDYGYFHDSRRCLKKIEDIEDLDDIIFIDHQTLETAFNKIGYYKLGILLAVATGNARQKIISTLSEKILTAVRADAPDRESVDIEEAIEIEDELIESIKKIGFHSKGKS